MSASALSHEIPPNCKRLTPMLGVASTTTFIYVLITLKYEYIRENTTKLVMLMHSNVCEHTQYRFMYIYIAQHLHSLGAKQ